MGLVKYNVLPAEGWSQRNFIFVFFKEWKKKERDFLFNKGKYTSHLFFKKDCEVFFAFTGIVFELLAVLQRCST